MRLPDAAAVEQTLIEEYPGGMDRLRGDELERLDMAEEKLAEREKELAIENGALRQARQRLEKSGSVDPAGTRGAAVGAGRTS